MKANITNLKKVLKICAKAHNTTFHDWSIDGQFGLHSETPGTICDVQMICEAFFGKTEPSAVEPGYGYVTVWLCYDFLPEVDERLCMMALPYGTKLS